MKQSQKKTPADRFIRPLNPPAIKGIHIRIVVKYICRVCLAFAYPLQTRSMLGRQCGLVDPIAIQLETN